ncbi:glycosyltransferase family 2 protein [Chloroflexota bacterium]
MFRGKYIGVVVPAYNEEKHIDSAIRNVPDFVDRIIVVNDASTDSTYENAASIALQSMKVLVISHKENRGVGAAIVTGYKKCLEEGIDITAIMAGDGDMDPAFLPDLLTPIIEDKADYVKTNRFSQPEYTRGLTKWRRSGNWLLRFLTRIASGNYAIVDSQSGYTAISREMLIKLNPDNIFTYYGYCNDMLVKLSALKARILEIPAPYMYRQDAITSKIRYHAYIPKVSWLLLRDFLWRLKVKYLNGGRS